MELRQIRQGADTRLARGVPHVEHDGSALFDGIRSPFDAGRYHSLAVASSALPDELVATARTETGTVMALAHVSLPIVGVQFHPESVLTDGGYRLLGNWLETVGVEGAAARGADLSPHRHVDPAHTAVD